MAENFSEFERYRSINVMGKTYTSRTNEKKRSLNTLL